MHEFGGRGSDGIYMAPPVKISGLPEVVTSSSGAYSSAAGASSSAGGVSSPVGVSTSAGISSPSRVSKSVTPYKAAAIPRDS